MLVLTRRVGEEVIIDGNIRVAVVSVQGERVRIGVSAPAYIPVDREEVHVRRQARSDAPESQQGHDAAMTRAVGKYLQNVRKEAEP
jgi:carbon storage regulator